MTAGMSLRAGSRPISPAEKDSITCSNFSKKQRHKVVLKVQLSKKATLTSKKACLALPQLHPSDSGDTKRKFLLQFEKIPNQIYIAGVENKFL